MSNTVKKFKSKDKKIKPVKKADSNHTSETSRVLKPKSTEDA